MIKEVKEFIEDFFKAELNAKTLDVKSDVVKAEQAINELYNYCLEGSYNRLGVVIPVRVMDSAYYERRKNVYYTIPRHLFKISRYKNDKYGEVYLAYCSNFIPDEDWVDIYRMQYCFIVCAINGQYKIIGRGSVDPDNLSKWDYDFGVLDFNFNSPGEFIETERYVEPIHDKDNPNLQKYWRDE